MRAPFRLRGPALAALATALLAGACGDDEPPTDRTALENETYLTRSTSEGSVTLRGGEATVPGTERGNLAFELLRTAEGDLDFDGEPDAAAVVAEASSQDVLLHLHALLSDGEQTQDVSARLLGDRLEIRRLSIDDGLIRVDLMIRNPGEPVTVPPSVPVSTYYALTERGLTPAAPTRVAESDQRAAPGEDGEAASPPTLSSHEWVLTAFSMGEWSGDVGSLDPPPSLRFVPELSDVAGSSGQFTGFAGCNRLFGSYRAEEGETLRIAGVAATRKMCGDDEMDFERRFAAAVASVESYEIRDGELIASFAGGELRFRTAGRLLPPAAETMSFDPDDPLDVDPPSDAEPGRRT